MVATWLTHVFLAWNQIDVSILISEIFVLVVIGNTRMRFLPQIIAQLL